MARYQLEPGDYGLVRFVVSPLTELGNSLRALRAPSSYPLQAPWYAAVCGIRDQLPLDVLRGLIGPTFDTPDLFNPRAGVPLTIDAQLAYLRDQDLRTLGADIESAVGGVPRGLGPASGRSFGHRLADALAAYWRLAFRPHWPRMQAVLDADVALRARSLAAEGVIATLNGCGPGVRADRTSITAHILGRSDDDLVLTTRGRPLFVVPSLFTLSSSTPLTDSDPMVMYGASNQRSMWTDPGYAGGTALLSPHRLRYLRALGTGMTTTALADRFGVSPSAANQSLRAMTTQGLLRTRRDGRTVVYERTTLGDQLADLR